MAPRSLLLSCLAVGLLAGAVGVWKVSAQERPRTGLPVAPPSLLIAHDGTDWAPASRTLRPGGPPAIVPLDTRDPFAVRSVAGPGGHRFRLLVEEDWLLVGGADGRQLRLPRVTAALHPSDHRVLLVDGRPMLVGPPRQPESVRGVPTPEAGFRTEGERNLLPDLARRDGVALRGFLHVVPPAGLDTAQLVLVPAGLERATAPIEMRVSWDVEEGQGGATRARVEPGGLGAIALTAPRAPFGLQIEGGSVDQLYFAHVEPIEVDTTVDLGPSRLVGTAPVGKQPLTWRRGGAWVPEDVPTNTLAMSDDEPRAGLLVEFVVPSPGAKAEAGEHEAWTLLATIQKGSSESFQAVELEPLPPAPDRSHSGGFVDVAPTLGVAQVHFEGPNEQLDIRPTMGPGVAWGDVDGDGWVDLYLVQGGGRAASEPDSNRLFRNLGGDGGAHRGFVDATDAMGGGDSGAGMGAVLADLDGDGFLDLYVANQGTDAVYANRARGRGRRFVDRSEPSGVAAADLWSAGVAAADPDRDGDLDLYVTSYLVYDESLMPPVEELVLRREDPLPMLPFAFPGQRNRYLRNESQGDALAFTDATEELGLLDEGGRGMQPVFWDYDHDGSLDLYVANDVSPNLLLDGDGNGGFRDVSFQTGMDDPRGGMGVALGDADGDLDEDLFLTNWQLESNALYRNNLVAHQSQRRRVASFRDTTVEAGLAPWGVGYTSWGCVLFDADLDGDLDLFVANGYTSPDYESTGICVGQPDHLFTNDGSGHFEPAQELAGPDVLAHWPSRAVAACDYDRDGDLDLAVTANNAPFRLLENRVARGGRWLVLQLRGKDGNTHAIGAEVTIVAGDRRFRRVLRAGESYLASGPPELHFGLGGVDAIDEVLVRWPSGRETAHPASELDAVLVIEEPRE